MESALSLCSILCADNIREFMQYKKLQMRENIRPAPRQFILWTSLFFFFGCSVSGCSLGSTSAATRGRELFQNCTPCHQSDGSGNPEIGAPNIAAMKAWYVRE